MFPRNLHSMKKLSFIICLCVCELCYSQEPQRIFHELEERIAYDSTTLDHTLKQIIPTDARTTFTTYKMNKVQENSILLRLHQYYGDYRILNSDLLVHIENGIITTINGSYYSSIDNLENVSSLSESEIVQNAETEVFESTSDYDFRYTIEKVMAKNSFDSEDTNLYYASRVTVSDGKNLETAVDVIIDEQSGQILDKISRVIYARGTANTRYSGTQTIGTTYEDSKYVLKDATRGNGIYTRNLNHSNNTAKLTEFTDTDDNWTTAEYHNSNKDDGALDVHWAAMKIPCAPKTIWRPSYMALPTSGTEWLPTWLPNVSLVLQPTTTMSPFLRCAASISSAAALAASDLICSTMFLSSIS